ncbi:hypothetical protein BJ508DRAFT_309392 [Ascobolus immersus RN42]|uniref:Uncharacterized protein n=1 Tax=Ascobolus immersus RN42 TaxID=1160509 RepID=A0A3N4HWT5_ASCIM|nr:hypothetical protein BJ508DRAFT_309392 [Ascobolus immersus RN42]
MTEACICMTGRTSSVSRTCVSTRRRSVDERLIRGTKRFVGAWQQKKLANTKLSLRRRSLSVKCNRKIKHQSRQERGRSKSKGLNGICRAKQKQEKKKSPLRIAQSRCKISEDKRMTKSPKLLKVKVSGNAGQVSKRTARLEGFGSKLKIRL